MPDLINHPMEDWKRIRNFAAEHQLPIAGNFLYTVEQGALFGNANDLADIGRLAAPLVHKILQGIPAGTIPVVSPEQDLFINYKRAQELGFQVPEGLLRQASEIVR
jgi:putative tryptophan/tyrosine transport system substrate-binding protein